MLDKSIDCCLICSSAVVVSIVIVTNFIFKHWLGTTFQIVNPVKMIVKVLNYARKNMYPRNRSALIYWEKNYPSRLNFGMDKYGGPFSEEQVEDVKGVISLPPLFIYIVGLFLAEDVKWISYYKTDEQNSLHLLIALLLILFYQLMGGSWCNLTMMTS